MGAEIKEVIQGHSSQMLSKTIYNVELHMEDGI